MNVLVSGASGFIGSALVSHLIRAGHRVIELQRIIGARLASVAPNNRPENATEAGRAPPHWDPDTGQINFGPAGPIDAAIHLAGENIAQRWTAKAKGRIRNSRVRGTELISRALAALQPRPRALLCASAVGYYGNRGEQVLTEESKAGEGFLPEVCREWEAACVHAANAGIRVVNLRFGVVLDPRGGALKKMLPLFRICLAGRLGSGRQYWSWVTRSDSVRVIEYALNNETLRGPINVMAPNPVRNSEFTKTLAHVLHRCAPFPAPAFALRLLLGEMADDALLASTRAVPQRLQRSGFLFEHNELEPALRKILNPR